MAKQPPAETSKPTGRGHLKYAGIKGAANLLRKHGHIDEVTHGDIVKHADRNMNRGKRK